MLLCLLSSIQRVPEAESSRIKVDFQSDLAFVLEPGSDLLGEARRAGICQAFPSRTRRETFFTLHPCVGFSTLPMKLMNALDRCN